MAGKFRRRVKRHTEGGGRGHHYEKDSEGVRSKITYRLFDCRHCDAEAIASKADFDGWDEVWTPVKRHLKDEHPEKLDTNQGEI